MVLWPSAKMCYMLCHDVVSPFRIQTAIRVPMSKIVDNEQTHLLIYIFEKKKKKACEKYISRI